MHIKNNDWKKLHRVNDQLDALKNREFQNWMTPVSCFVTFESEEGYQRALYLKSSASNVTILGQRPFIEEATEPTNVIWEHREFTAF